MHPDDLEHVVDRALKGLPRPRAPHTLLPRVMTAVRHAGARTPYARSWFAWPIGWQLVSAAALVPLFAGLWLALPMVQAAVAPMIAALAAGPAGRVLGIVREAEAMSSAAGAVWRAIVQPLVWFVLPLVFLMWAACATFGAALSRVALGGATQP